MADIYEQNLAQKTTLTTSDYIRVVGSDNVSYKQKVSDVKATFGVSWHTYSTLTTKADLLAQIDADLSAIGGQGSIVGYMTNTQAVLLGLPNASYYMTMFANSTNYREVRFTNTGGTAEYILPKQNGTWASSPVPLPTKTEVDALKTKFANTTFSSVSDLYNAVINNSVLLGVATGTVVGILTNGDSQSASRFIGYKADATTVDILMFAASNGKIVISRIANGTPTRAYRVALTQLTL